MRKLVSVLHLYGWRLTVLALTWREWKKWLEPSEDRLKNVEQDHAFVFFWRSLYIRGSLNLSACERNLNLVNTQKSWMSLERERVTVSGLCFILVVVTATEFVLKFIIYKPHWSQTWEFFICCFLNELYPHYTVHDSLNCILLVETLLIQFVTACSKEKLSNKEKCLYTAININCGMIHDTPKFPDFRSFWRLWKLNIQLNKIQTIQPKTLERRVISFHKNIGNAVPFLSRHIWKFNLKFLVKWKVLLVIMTFFPHQCPHSSEKEKRYAN